MLTWSNLVSLCLSFPSCAKNTSQGCCEAGGVLRGSSGAAEGQKIVIKHPYISFHDSISCYSGENLFLQNVTRALVKYYIIRWLF